MRRAKIEDVSTLLKLARMVHFINLPPDKDIITDKVQWSRQCFAETAKRMRPDGTLGPDPAEIAEKGGRKRTVHAAPAAGGRAVLTDRSKLFMFVLEDVETRSVLGTSQIITSMGGPGQPNLSFELKRKEKFSTTLQIGTTHTVAKLKLDESGPTEIGGLILLPGSRGHRFHLGRFLSLVRFHFMGLYRPVVADRIIAEMMGPITPDGQNTLWEYLGRRFINLTYTEADRFCQYSKEFMLSLLPREEIYLTLLPPEARRIIAQVGPETEPARRMLENLGFAYNNCIDPFDGGPTLEAITDNISVVKRTKRVRIAGRLAPSEPGGITAMLSTLDRNGEYRAIQIACALEGKDAVRLSADDISALGIEVGASVGFTQVIEESPKRGGRGAERNGTVEKSAKPRAKKRGKRETA